MKPPKPYRIPCEVPGCKRTIGDVSPNRWWICPAHWSAVPKEMRRVLSRYRRRRSRINDAAGDGAHQASDAECRIVRRIFREAGAPAFHKRRCGA